MLKITLKIVNYFKLIDEKDIEVLETIENLMKLQLRVRIDDIVKKIGYSDSFIQKRLNKYNKMNLIETKRLDNHYTSVRLKFMGYDALALHYLVKNKSLHSIGSSIGIGKESNVFLGLLENNEECVVKFHKLGKTKFKATKRKRSFLAEKTNSSKLYESTLNARREVEALNELAGIIKIPKIFGYNRHVIMMQKINGMLLHKSDFFSQSDFLKIFNQIIGYIQTMVKVGIVHGDLSEYNILVTSENEELEVYVIDWPQYLRLDHENAFDALIFDLYNIYSFFSKKISVRPNNIEELAHKLMQEAKNR